MLVTFNIAFLYINILFRFLKRKVVSIENADDYSLENRDSEIQYNPTVSDIVNGESDTNTNVEDEKARRIQEIHSSSNQQPHITNIGNDNIFNFDSCEANSVSNSDFNVNYCFDSNEILEANTQKMDVGSLPTEQDQNSFSCVENPAVVCNGSSDEQVSFEASANCASNYYISESEFETDRGIRFFPPVYIQRYNAVKSILTCEELKGKVRKVVEFGCAEMTFFALFLKRVYEIEEVIEVDIDSNTLNQYFHKISPQTSDYIKMRTTPLKVQLYEGSVAYTHSCLSGANAVICIELIEHLYPEELDALPFTIFGYIRPQVAIFTTPNADFNVLFPGLSGFRHPDHKFEWSQEQFQSWANNLIVRYSNYRVSFMGIGKNPSGSEEYGYCSQMAVFFHNTPEVQNVDSSDSPLDKTVQAGEYKSLRQYDFPVYIDERTEEQKIRDDAVFYINRCRSIYRCESDSSREIPLTAILANVNCLSLAKLRDILEGNNWKVQKNEYGELVIPISDSENEEFSDDDNDYYCKGEASEFQGAKSDNVSNEYMHSDEDWNEQCDSGNNTVNLSVNNSTKNNEEILTEPQCILDTNNGYWTSENQRGYNPVDSKQSSQEREMWASDSSNVFSELTLLNESQTDVLESSTLPAADLSELNTETSHYEDKMYCNKELTSYNFDNSIYKTPCKSDFFCSQATPSKSFSEEDGETLCNSRLTETAPTEDSFMHVFYSPDCHKESFKQHNNEKENKTCSCCNSVLQNEDVSFRIPEVPSKLLTAEELDKTAVLTYKQSEEQLHFNDTIESNENSEILVGPQDSCSACKAVDSGYPNTLSCQDMDMDLTPEQVDEILTENGSSLNGVDDDDVDVGVGDNEMDSDNNCNDNDDEDEDNAVVGGENNGDEGGGVIEELLRPGSPVQFPIAPLGQNVENGDLVNNNQDNEGNNVIGQIDGEILEFDVQINENGDLPVLAAGERHGEDRANDEIDDLCKNPEVP